MGIRYVVTGLDEAIAEVRSLQHPSRTTIEKLDHALTRQFLDSASKVHTNTGALLSTGTQSSDYNRLLCEWVGEISWGGAPYSDTAWAASEEIRRGGEHSDYWDCLVDGRHDESYINAINDHYRGTD